MSKKSIVTDKAPGAIGPYSQAIDIGNLVFTSGQIPLDPRTGEIPEGIEEQTQQVLNNVQSILEAAGLEMKDVVKTTVFIKDMNQFAAMNEVYKTFFVEPYPARSTVEVARLPKDVLVEIETITLRS